MIICLETIKQSDIVQDNETERGQIKLKGEDQLLGKRGFPCKEDIITGINSYFRNANLELVPNPLFFVTNKNQ